MNNDLRRAARRALKPDAIIPGAATCLFGWALAEAMRPRAEEYAGFQHWETLFLASTLLVAAAGLATKKRSGDLLAAVLSGPLPLIVVFTLFLTPARFSAEVIFFSARHFELWLGELARAPVSFWLMTTLSTAILCSATAATLRRTTPRP